MRKLFLILCGACCYMQAHAFPCFITMVKDSCWTQYNVQVSINSATGKVVATSSIPEGKSWDRQEFSCQPEETLSLNASFTPVFWQADTGKIYASRHNWSLPQEIKKGVTAWNITVCYPRDFAEVPLPPGAGTNCKCVTDTIPPVKPQ